MLAGCMDWPPTDPVDEVISINIAASELPNIGRFVTVL